MKPKTKLQIRVAKLSKWLPEISHAQFFWAKKNCFDKKGFLRKKSVWCLECGNTWKADEKQLLVVKKSKIICPLCNAKIKIQESFQRTYSSSEYYTIITTKEEFQVLRHFIIEKKVRVGEQPIYNINEAVQNWIAPNGKQINMSRLTYQSIYYDAWVWCSEIEIRGKPSLSKKYDIYANHIYPRIKYIPELKRNGFNGNFHNIHPVNLFTSLLTIPKAETLMKAGQYALLRFFIKNEHPHLAINSKWQSIKICIRNNYIIKDAEMWLDYIVFLSYFRKDLTNAHYVCPADLNKAHDHYMLKKRKIEAEKAREEKRKKAEIENADFLKLKGKYIGIAFTDGFITIKTLDNVLEYVFESAALSHCVYESDYHLKTNSLILSARIDGVPVETIEVSLKDFKILQCRGKYNKDSEHHERIMKLVNKNIHQIRKRKYQRKTA